MKTLIFEDEIILFWKPEERFKDAAYKLFLNGKLLKTSDKTHFEIKNLTPETEYEIKKISYTTDYEYDETMDPKHMLKYWRRSVLSVNEYLSDTKKSLLIVNKKSLQGFKLLQSFACARCNALHGIFSDINGNTRVYVYKSAQASQSCSAAC